MMLVRAHGFTIDRGAAGHVEVELDVRAGLPGLAVIGLGARPARELRERVQAAILNSGYSFPRRRVTVNLAPPAQRAGAELDLAVACCVLAAAASLAPSRLERIGLCAELALGGELRPCGGGAALADAAAGAGLVGLIVAAADREAAALAGTVPVGAAGSLREVAGLLSRVGQRGRPVPRAGARTARAP